MYNPKFTTKSLFDDYKTYGAIADVFAFHGCKLACGNVYPSDHEFHDCAPVVILTPDGVTALHWNLTQWYKDKQGTLNSCDDTDRIFSKYYPHGQYDDKTWYRMLCDKLREVYKEEM